MTDNPKLKKVGMDTSLKQGFEQRSLSAIRFFHTEVANKSIMRPSIMKSIPPREMLEYYWPLVKEIYERFKDLVPETELDEYNPDVVRNMDIKGLELPRIMYLQTNKHA